MSPRSTRYLSTASGDVAAPVGRHRRAEPPAGWSLLLAPAEAGGRPIARPVRRAKAPAHRASPASEPDNVSWWASAATSAFSTAAVAARRPAAGGPRHSAVVRAAAPPVTGSHRAPGTLPIETWLMIGKKRQQVLLASLVAAALLLITVPMRQNGIDAVDAAVASVVGGHSAPRKPANPPPGPGHRPDAPADSRTPAPGPSSAVRKPSGEPQLASAWGPGHSMRTTGGTAISLTFDDGPDPVQTPKILALLDKYQVKATFCLVGKNVVAHPEIVREIVAAGHTLCDHTWSHSLTIGKQTAAEIDADLGRTNAAIRAAVPGVQIPFFRAPGGNFTDRLVSVAKAAGMASLYWAVDPRDWDHPAGETDDAHIARVIEAIHKSAQPGAIILSHDFAQPDTIAAYAQLLPWLTTHFTFTIPGRAPSTPATAGPTTGPTTGPTPAASTPSPTGAADVSTGNSADGSE